MDEEIWINDDLVLVPLEVLVCAQCGERYYNRQAMRKLELRTVYVIRDWLCSLRVVC